jgi:hypothetical protein
MAPLLRRSKLRGFALFAWSRPTWDDDVYYCRFETRYGMSKTELYRGSY